MQAWEGKQFQEVAARSGGGGGFKWGGNSFTVLFCQEQGWKDAGGPGSSLPDAGLLLPLCHQLYN